MAEVVSMPKLGFDMAEGTLVRWVVAEGQPVEKGAVLAEIETDKATVEVESSASGVVLRHMVAEGTPVPVGDPIALVGQPGEQPEAPPQQAQAPVEEKAAEAPTPAASVQPEVEKVEAGTGDGRLPGGVRASPVARRMAEERGIDLRQVKGTGPGGRVTKSDIEAYREAPKVEPAVVERAAVTPIPALPVAAREDRRIPVSRLRGIIGRRMVESVTQAPQFFVTHEYDVAALLELRKQVNALIPEEEKLSVNDYLVKAVALTLREFPNLNARLDATKNEVIQFGRINIGNAVAMENGLLTVVVRDADFKSIRQIAAELHLMSERARQGKVRPEDIEGSTFSISNMGMFDVEHFTAIVNPPEVAILAVGSARQIAVVEAGEIKPGWRMKATISIDHRVSDGAEAARFMQALAKAIEQPLRLLV